MELTFGELAVIAETLEISLGFINWSGFSKESRKDILTKLYNAKDLKFEIRVKDETRS